MLNGIFGSSNGNNTVTVDDIINDTGDSNNRNVPITSGGSWWEDLLNAAVLTNKNYSDTQAQIAASQNRPVNIIPPSPYPLGVTPVATQGAQAGAAVGSFADNAVKFVGKNWLIFAGLGAAFVLYETTPKRNGIRKSLGL